MSTAPTRPVQPLTMTAISVDALGNLEGLATGESCREILRNLAHVATEEQARAILTRIGTLR
jgi:hypothetical protein